MRILCIGDSNTWGYNPMNGRRYERRWTKVLGELMPEHEIVEEGLNGRTVLSMDPIVKERCGITGLSMLLMSHKPVDYVVVMLGTNEMKKYFKCNANYVAKGIGEFIKVIQTQEVWRRFEIPKTLIVSPILIRDEIINNGDIFGEYDENSVIQSKLLASAVSDVCREYKVDFLNAADYAQASTYDCIHMDEENHQKLAEAIFSKLKELI